MTDRAVSELIERVTTSLGRSLDDWLACFAEPLVLATEHGTLVLDREAAEALGTRMFEDLRDRGFDHSEIQSVTIAMHDDDIAFVDARFHRMRLDGSLLEAVGAGYLCRRRDEGWLIVTLAPGSALTTDPTSG